jgi:hypothetical protein
MCICVEITQIHGYTHGLDISLLLSSQLLPKSFNDTDMPESSPHRYPSHILSDNHSHHMCICVGIGTRENRSNSRLYLCISLLLICPLVPTPENHSNARYYDRTARFTGLILSTCAKVLQSLSYTGFKSSQVPHTYSVSQPLLSPVYLYGTWVK